MSTLLEAYKNRLAISEAVHQKSHNGAKMSADKKMLIASCLNNTSKFLNEAFDSVAATQRSSLGDFKKFCLNVSTTAIPNLILPDLMLTQPMTSYSGYVTYLRFTTGTNKGGVNIGTLVSDPYRYGKMDENRANYTSSRVVESVETFTSGTTTIAWAPAVAGSIKLLDVNGKPVKLTAGSTVTADAEGKVTVNGNTEPLTAVKKIAYVYDNVTIPQEDEVFNTQPTSLPTLKASMVGISLRAHARRIAVYYSQMAAYQAKQDYGYDLADQLSAQAQGELAYEIDTEGVMLLDNGAQTDASLYFPTYEAQYTGGTNLYISRSQYYEGFSEVIAKAKSIIYARTQKFAPTYMVIGTDVLAVMPFVKGWTAAPAGTINGPYFAGTVDGLKVYVSPSIAPKRFFFGVNGSDLRTSAAVYAPYMAIVPTQLLGFADGTMTQGFRTLYDMKLLSPYNVDEDGNPVDIYENANTESGVADIVEAGQYSWLLVGGMLEKNPNA